jgi:hypothetical protein
VEDLLRAGAAVHHVRRLQDVIEVIFPSV